MLLAIDIGNTHIVLGLFHRAKLLWNGRLASSTQRTEDELWTDIYFYIAQNEKAGGKIDGVVIASVVPPLTDIARMMVQKYLNLTPVIITSSLDVGIPIQYDDPSRIGADRICNAVAAYKKFGGPAIVIDFGTATTYDVISKSGEYVGGVIAIGLETSAAELHRRTAQLPRIDLHVPDAVVGKNTIAAMQSGILYGAVDAAEGMIRRIRRVIGKHAIVIATGGHATTIAALSTEIRYVEPTLVLEGARLIHERVKGKRTKS